MHLYVRARVRACVRVVWPRRDDGRILCPLAARDRDCEFSDRAARTLSRSRPGIFSCQSSFVWRQGLEGGTAAGTEGTFQGPGEQVLRADSPPTSRAQQLAATSATGLSGAGGQETASVREGLSGRGNTVPPPPGWRTQSCPPCQHLRECERRAAVGATQQQRRSASGRLKPSRGSGQAGSQRHSLIGRLV